ncbi:MAG: hypothetical protein O2782_02810 [bacterium]|nr:hypothetical protein [bacterium]
METSVSWDTDAATGEELYWCDADLTDVVFEFLPQPLLNRADRRQSRLAYVRLQPLTGGPEPSAHTAATRTAGAVIDGHEMVGAYGPTTPDAVRGMIAPFVDSDFRRLHFGCTCTTMRLTYLTQVGHWLGQDQPLESLHSDHNRRCARTLQAAAADGWDPVDVMIDFARSHDMELWADFRIQQDYAFDYFGGFGYDFNSPSPRPTSTGGTSIGPGSGAATASPIFIRAGSGTGSTCWPSWRARDRRTCTSTSPANSALCGTSTRRLWPAIATRRVKTLSRKMSRRKVGISSVVIISPTSCGTCVTDRRDRRGSGTAHTDCGAGIR